MSQCPHCQHEIDDSDNRPRFCTSCGGDLAPSEDQKKHVYLDSIKAKMEGGDLSVESIKELTDLRKTLGVSSVDADRLRDAAVESSRPSRRDDLDQPVRSVGTEQVRLAINVNQLYMQDMDSVLDIRLDNLSDEALDAVDVEISGNLVGRTLRWSGSVAAGQSRRRRFEVRPPAGGLRLVEFVVNARQGEVVHSYAAQSDMPVLEPLENIHKVVQQMGDIVNFGGGTGESKIMGNAVNINIDSLMGQGRIKSVNDLITEYSKLPPDFQALELDHDPQRSEELTEALHRRRQAPKAKSVVEPSRGSKTDAACLMVRNKQAESRVLLLAKAEVKLGMKKAPANDIVTRLLPRSYCEALKRDPVRGCGRPSCHDCQTKRISREHCLLTLTQTGVTITDLASACGTTLDGRPLTGEPALSGDHCRLVLADALNLIVRCLRKQRLTVGAYEEALSGPLGPLWGSATSAQLNAVTVRRIDNLGPDDPNGSERYCLVYRAATIGSDPDAAIDFKDHGLEPLQALLLYLSGSFYLENLTDLSNVCVNGHVLSKGELWPLCFGDRVELARLRLEFGQSKQLYLD